MKGTEIYFNNNGMDDATQFDTTDETELAALWWEFCKENNLIQYEEVEVEDE